MPFLSVSTWYIVLTHFKNFNFLQDTKISFKINIGKIWDNIIRKWLRRPKAKSVNP
jgi:hypothetical protein